jgi:hypothetical protein
VLPVPSTVGLSTLTIIREGTNYEVRQYVTFSTARLLYLSNIPDILNPRHTEFPFLRTKDPVPHSYTAAGFCMF